MNSAARCNRQIHSLPTRSFKPVVLWAWIGAMCLLASFCWIGKWMFSVDFSTTHPSPRALVETSASTRTLISIGEILSLLTALFFFALWFIKPKVKEGRFSFMGILCLASMSSYALNPTENYYSYGIAYSSFLHNWGSWANEIPGFSYPNQNKFPEAPLMWGASFVWFNLVFALLFYWLWKQLDFRFPRMGVLGKIAALLLAMFATDVLFESLVLRTQLYAYIGAIQKWCFFGGHYYQFPIFVGGVTAIFWLAVTSLLYYRDDRGHSWAERGVETLEIPGAGKTFVRFLALTGAMWVISITTYYAPIQWLYTHGDSFPADTPDHLLNTHVLCGEHLGYACPGKGVPIPRRD